MFVYKDIIGKLKKAGHSTYQIRESGLLSEGTMQSFRTGKPVNIKTIDTVCQILHCKIEDIVEIIQDK